MGFDTANKRKSPKDLEKRLIWGFLVGFGALFIFWWGSPLVEVAFLAMLWRLCYEWVYFKEKGDKPSFFQAYVLLGLSLTVLFLAAREYGTWWALGALVISTSIIFVFSPGKYRNWNVLANFYMGLPAIASAWVLKYFAHGSWFILWVILLVALTDIGAYFAGTILKGPKLAPKISPNKTWAGFVGGLLGSLIGGVMGLLICSKCYLVNLLVFSVFVSLAAIVGDLLESYLKRQHGLKDTKPLIPGHGGLLDRVDAYLIAIPVAVALIRIFPGKLPFVLLP